MVQEVGGDLGRRGAKARCARPDDVLRHQDGGEDQGSAPNCCERPTRPR
jgi:hypothetical protein